MSTTTYSVDGLHCQGCVNTVTRTITALPDVKSVSVDLNTRGVSTVTIDAGHELATSEIQEALDKEGNFAVV